ncbi:MAG: hypothetical protein GX593_02200 [Actinomycetales bacterium]|nr:hypothetical protein [Actinomycetales bacterium]
MRLLKRRSEYSARGPVPPWWRRPGVLAVVGLLVVGGALTASEGVRGLISSREVRATTVAVRQMPLPASLTEWQAACGIYGIRCAQSADAPEVAVEAVADVLRQMGHEVEAARCGTEARIDLGTTLASVVRHESQCTVVTEVPGGSLTVAAWDYVPPLMFGADGDGLELDRTALVVEWDSAGTERLLVAEPGLDEARFGDVRITAEEIAALPGALAGAECTGTDADGCIGWETELEGPGEGRDLVEHWARQLLAEEFLVTSFECDLEGSGACSLGAVAGRGAGEATMLGVSLALAADDHSRVWVTVSTA